MPKAFLSLAQFVDLSKIQNRDFFTSENIFAYLGSDLKEWITALLAQHGVTNGPVIAAEISPLAVIEGPVFIAKGAVVEPHVYIQGPAFIASKAEIRHGAYIRGHVYVGSHAVVGHTTEVKGSVFMDHAKAGHFAYVGDSFLGRNVNLGAGTKLANLKLKGDEVKVSEPGTGKRIPSGLRKFGAVMGDESQTGCNAVLAPGTLLMPRSLVYPTAHFVGTLAESQSFKG